MKIWLLTLIFALPTVSLATSKLRHPASYEPPKKELKFPHVSEREGRDPQSPKIYKNTGRDFPTDADQIHKYMTPNNNRF